MAETIMVVDDDVAARDLLSGILTEAGYKVEQADGAAAALAQSSVVPPDLVLLDLLMPGMNGFEVCRRLKELPATNSVPVIVVTALGEIRDKEAALTSGADDFVMKPVQPEDLRARVSAMLKVRRIRQDLDRTLAYILELEAARHGHRREMLASLLAAPLSRPKDAPTVSTVLLVEDEALDRQFYGDLFADHGLHVLAAGSGPEGLALARVNSLDTAILDILMPEMSGLEVLERLRERDPNLPVIMLTAHATSQNAIAALKLGAFDFILKGLEPELVVMAVHRAVRHRRDTLHKKREVELLRARIAQLEGAKPQG
jgi:two-component system cell cycle response regulator